jgi:RNA polymerase sigma-70 factor (ECF subfamily)
VLRAGVLHVSGAAAAPAGTAEAWRELESRLRPFVARRVAASDVDDVLQDVFVRMQRHLADLRDEERLAPWVFSIARNVVTDHHRRRREVDGDGAPEPIAEPGEDDALTESLTGCVARFVAELDPDAREAITLVELQGMSQKDAAELLGLSHSGMKSRVQRGRAELRRMFERACAIELDARRKVIECQPRACGGCAPPERG